ncbi:uncharacterized protein ARMOST_22358 [Armillaria ostoyae]|uniref:Uncharacterized protein n=1 Tax=Armillaria ostoyae TaxID=47428 RepID=A0A284SCL9_ARMOS|nr:uncharacterized protein ARMOST_22358 [Armillaria ostoyae]
MTEDIKKHAPGAMPVPKRLLWGTFIDVYVNMNPSSERSESLDPTVRIRREKHRMGDKHMQVYAKDMKMVKPELFESDSDSAEYRGTTVATCEVQHAEDMDMPLTHCDSKPDIP